MSLRRPKREPLIDKSALPIQPQIRPVEGKESARFESAKHVSWIRGLACLCCGRPATPDQRNEGAHLRKDTQTPKGRKPHDFWLWPACNRCHRLQHVVGEDTFWRDHLKITVPARYVLFALGLQSPCARTRDLAQKEWENRYV